MGCISSTLECCTIIIIITGTSYCRSPVLEEMEEEDEEEEDEDHG